VPLDFKIAMAARNIAANWKKKRERERDRKKSVSSCDMFLLGEY